MSKRTISIHMETLLYNWYFVQNLTAPEIADKLEKENNIKISIKTVTNIIAKQKKERDKIMRDVITEEIKEALTHEVTKITACADLYARRAEEIWNKLTEKDKNNMQSFYRLANLSLKCREVSTRAAGLSNSVSNQDLAKELKSIEEKLEIDKDDSENK